MWAYMERHVDKWLVWGCLGLTALNLAAGGWGEASLTAALCLAHYRLAVEASEKDAA